MKVAARFTAQRTTTAFFFLPQFSSGVSPFDIMAATVRAEKNIKKKVRLRHAKREE